MGKDDGYDAVRYAIMAERMSDGMNTKDIDVALMFIAGYEYDHVYLQCKTARDIPYVKRALIQAMGVPSKMIDNSFYYHVIRGGQIIYHGITIVPISKELLGVDPTRVFYVAYKDDSDWRELCAQEGVKQRLVPYDMWPWLNEADIYGLLISDGMSGDEALHKMKCDGLI